MSVPTIQLTDSATHGINAPQGFAAIPAAPQTVKLGRRPPDKPLVSVPRLASYLDFGAMAAPPPDVCDYYTKAGSSLGRMYLNDQYGDCVIAGKYHTVGVWSGNDSASTIVGTDAEVYQSYQAICGPGDNGCVITSVLDAMRSSGLPFGGVRHTIDGYVAVDWTNKDMVKAALFIFGNLTLGINLPQAWTSSSIWDVTTSGIVGGHDVAAVGYRADGVIISSWGKLYVITWAAFTSRKWLEECYVLLGPDWYGNDKVAPSGIDVVTLKADLAKIAAGAIPGVDPGPGPSPIPSPTPLPTAFGVSVGLTTPPGKSSPWSNGLAVGSTANGTCSVKITAATSQVHESAPDDLHLLAASPGAKLLNGLKIMADVFAVVFAFKSGNLAGLKEAAEKLLADLGFEDPTPND